jgi:hypothetical protein
LSSLTCCAVSTSLRDKSAAKSSWACRWDFRAGLILVVNMFYLNKNLIVGTPGAPDAMYETSKEIDAE